MKITKKQLQEIIREEIQALQSLNEGESRPLHVIAREIQSDWGSKVNYAAKPYLQAMKQLDSINDNYMMDSARSVVLYFLSNASSWRGDTAKRIKKELKDMVKGK